jgi:hypothetical protein
MYSLSEPERAAILDNQLMQLAAQGQRVETRLQTSAVVVSGKPINNVLHLLLCVFCCGLWVPVWLLLGAFTGERRKTISVAENGQIFTQQVPLTPGRIALIVAACIAAAIWLLFIFRFISALGQSSSSSMVLIGLALS